MCIAKCLCWLASKTPSNQQNRCLIHMYSKCIQSPNCVIYLNLVNFTLLWVDCDHWQPQELYECPQTLHMLLTAVFYRGRRRLCSQQLKCHFKASVKAVWSREKDYIKWIKSLWICWDHLTPCPDCMQVSDEVGRGMLATRTEPVKTAFWHAVQCSCPCAVRTQCWTAG